MEKLQSIPIIETHWSNLKIESNIFLVSYIPASSDIFDQCFNIIVTYDPCGSGISFIELLHVNPCVDCYPKSEIIGLIQWMVHPQRCLT